MSIVLENINKTYNNQQIFKNFSFLFEDGNMYVLTGTVGVGKTTLLNIITQITDIDSGMISGMNDKKISYLFQDNRLIKSKNVSDNIRFVLKDSMNKIEANKVIEDYLKLFDLYEYRNYNVDKLSGGMQKKLAIARTLAIPNYDILILDEPFNNIDIKQKNIIMENIIKLVPKHAIVILVTHNVEDVINFVSEVYVLEKIPNSKFYIHPI